MSRDISTFEDKNKQKQINSYDQTRREDKNSKRNGSTKESLKMFKGSELEPYVNGFSSHALGFLTYLIQIKKNKKIQLNECEEAFLTLLFYTFYIKKSYHSFNEIDAAFHRSRELFSNESKKSNNNNSQSKIGSSGFFSNGYTKAGASIATASGLGGVTTAVCAAIGLISNPVGWIITGILAFIAMVSAIITFCCDESCLVKLS